MTITDLDRDNILNGDPPPQSTYISGDHTVPSKSKTTRELGCTTANFLPKKLLEMHGPQHKNKWKFIDLRALEGVKKQLKT